MNWPWLFAVLIFVGFAGLGVELEKVNKNLEGIRELLEPLSREAEERFSRAWREKDEERGM